MPGELVAPARPFLPVAAPLRAATPLAAASAAALLLLAGTLGAGSAAAGGDVAAALGACRAIAAGPERLACYDGIADTPPIAEFTGAGSAVTPRFEIAGPSRLRFESRDAIMVAYLLDASGAVVQNLHHGGVGEGTYLIERPGAYSVQVNASGGWRIAVERP